MNIKIFFLLAFFTNTLLCAPEQTKVFLSGSIDFPKEINDPAVFPFFYKGSIGSIEVDSKSKSPKKGYFEIYDNKDITELYIIITEYLSLPQSHDVPHLSTSSDHTYRHFKLTKESFGQWTIQELGNAVSKMPIADNTIIFFMNPDYIKKLVPIDNAGLRLPTIIFKDDITQKDLQDISIRMTVAAIDFKCLHKKKTKTSIAFAHNRIVSLPVADNKYLS